MSDDKQVGGTPRDVCILGTHIDPYLKGDNYYCSRCKQGMGNAYFEYRQKAECDLLAAQAELAAAYDTMSAAQDILCATIGSKVKHDRGGLMPHAKQVVAELAAMRERAAKAEGDALKLADGYRIVNDEYALCRKLLLERADDLIAAESSLAESRRANAMLREALITSA